MCVCVCVCIIKKACVYICVGDCLDIYQCCNLSPLNKNSWLRPWIEGIVVIHGVRQLTLGDAVIWSSVCGTWSSMGMDDYLCSMSMEGRLDGHVRRIYCRMLGSLFRVSSTCSLKPLFVGIYRAQLYLIRLITRPDSNNVELFFNGRFTEAQSIERRLGPTSPSWSAHGQAS